MATRKKAPAKKITKKRVKAAVPPPETTLWENSKLEQQSAPDTGWHERPYTRELFKLWVLIPPQFKGQMPRVIELLGLDEPVMQRLTQVRSQSAFAEEFGVGIATLSRWRNAIMEDEGYMRDLKKEMRKLTGNFIGALYRKGLEEADAARFKIWMQIVEDWREHLGVEHSGTVDTNLSPEDREALDKLIERNKTP